MYVNELTHFLLLLPGIWKNIFMEIFMLFNGDLGVIFYLNHWMKWTVFHFVFFVLPICHFSFFCDMSVPQFVIVPPQVSFLGAPGCHFCSPGCHMGGNGCLKGAKKGLVDPFWSPRA